MKKLKIFLLFVMAVIVATAAFACTQNNSTENGEEPIIVDYANISEITVNETDKLQLEGFNLNSFKLSDITLHIVYFSEETVDIPLTENMIKAEDKVKLSVTGEHSITVYYGKYILNFQLRLYVETESLISVTFLDETGDRVIEVQYLKEGESALEPRLGDKEGYTHIGWKDRNTNVMVTTFGFNKDTVLVAVYAPNYYEVNYYYTVGEVSVLLSTITLPRGANALEFAPEIPIVSGYRNGRWADEASMQNVNGEKLDFYAIYDSDKVEVTFSYFKYIEGEFYDETVSWNVDLATEGISPPDDAESVDEYAFIYWYVERDGKKIPVNFPYQVTGEINFKAYYVPYSDGTNGLEYTIDYATQTCELSGISETVEDEVIVIPQYVGGYPVTSIKGGIFKDREIKAFDVSASNKYFRVYEGVLYNLARTEIIAYPIALEKTEITLVDETKVIKEYAFAGAKNLEKINLPVGLTQIEKNAFEDCWSLKSLQIPGGVTVINEEILKNASSVSLLTVGNQVTEIKDRAFMGMNSLVEFSIPSTVVSIGENVFVGCGALSKITATANMEFIVDNGALYGYNEGKTNRYYYLYAYPAKFGGSSNSEYSVNSDAEVIKSGAFDSAAISGIFFQSTASGVLELCENSIVSSHLKSIRFDKTIKSVKLPDGNAEKVFGQNYPKKIYVANPDMTGLSGESYTLTTSPHTDYDSGFAYEVIGNYGASITAYRGHMTDLVIPNMLSAYQVIGISDNAFCNNYLLNSIVLPDSVKDIGEKSFYNCINLKEVTFGKSLVSIGDSAFENCNSLTTINDNKAILEEVGKNAFGEFKNNSNKIGLVVVAGVLLGVNGYSKNIVVPEEVVIIADKAFANESYISSVEFESNDNLLYINEYAFSHCYELESIDLPNSLVSIATHAFGNCINLVSVKTSANDIATDAFYMTPYLDSNIEVDECWETVNVNGDVVLNKFSGISEVIIIPEDITIISSNAFANNKYIKEVIISDSVREIGDNAFYGCENMVSLILGEGLRIIGEQAFADCYALRTVEFKESFNYKYNQAQVAYNAFDGTAWLRYYIDDSIIINDIYYTYHGQMSELHIKNSVIKINERAFVNELNLKTVYIPESVEEIGEYAFAYSNISEISFANYKANVKAIRRYAFVGCRNLIEINLAILSKLEIIEEYAFSEISPKEDALLHIVIPASVKIIEQYAFTNALISTLRFSDGSKIEDIQEGTFSGCMQLKSIVFDGKSNLYEIHSYAFAGCENLVTFINTDCKLEVIGESAFWGNNLLSEFKIAETNLKDIGKEAFYDCKFIRDNTDIMVFIGTVLVEYKGTAPTVLIPAKTTAIANSAFAGNSMIKSVIVLSENNHYNLVEIQNEAFKNCINLASVTFNYGLEKIGDAAFAGCKNLEKVEFPETLNSIGTGVFAGCLNLKNIVGNSNNFYTVDGVLFSYGKNNDGTRSATIVAYPNKNSIINESDEETVRDSYVIPESLKIGSWVYPITEIAGYAFSECLELNQIILPSGLLKIGEYAFYGIKAQIEFSANCQITELGKNSFAGFKGEDIYVGAIKNYIEFPNTVAKIGEKAFENAFTDSNIDGILKPIAIPLSVNDIGANAFGFVENDLVWHDKCDIEIIGTKAFANYMGKEIFIPGSVIEIGKYAFENVNAKIVWDDDIKINVLSNSAFYDYLGTNIEIPQTVKIIETRVFENCVNLVKIDIPSSVNSIGEYAFAGITAKVNLSNALTVIQKRVFAKYLGDEFIIPTQIINIEDYAFSECVNLKTVDFSKTNSSLTIGNYAFEKTKLESLYIPSAVEKIGMGAFADCENLKEIEIANEVQRIGFAAFSNCNLLENIKLPFVGENGNDNCYIGYVFGAESYDETDLYVPKTLKDVSIYSGNIKQFAFYNCKNLTKVYLSEYIIAINGGAFYGCDKLEVVTMPYMGVLNKLFAGNDSTTGFVPRTLTEICLIAPNNIDNELKLVDNAYDGCTQLKKITLPEELTEIGFAAFRDCSVLTEISIGKNVHSIGTQAFARCGSLKTINVSAENNHYVDNKGVLYQYNKDNKTATVISYPIGQQNRNYSIELQIENESYTIVSIGDYAFYYTKIVQIDIPDTVKQFGVASFAYSQITSVTVPSGIPIQEYTSADEKDDAFYSCKQLTKIYINSSEVANSIRPNEYSLYTNAQYVYVKATGITISQTAFLVAGSVFKQLAPIYDNNKLYNVFCKMNLKVVTLNLDTMLVGGTAGVDTGYGNALIDGAEGTEYTYIPNSKINLSAVERAGYWFRGWYLDTSDEPLSTDKDFDYIVPDNVTSIRVVARFIQNPTLTVIKSSGSTSDSGIIKIEGIETDTVKPTSDNRTVKMIAEANDGFMFIGWFIDDKICSVHTIYEYEMGYEDETITARFTYPGANDIYADWIVSDESNPSAEVKLYLISVDDSQYVLLTLGEGEFKQWDVPQINEEGITWADGSANIPPYYMNYRDKIIAIGIRDGVTSISDYSFAMMSELKEVSIASSVKIIGEYAFAFTPQLKDIKIESGIENLGEYFLYESGVNNFYIPDTVNTITNSSFEGSRINYITITNNQLFVVSDKVLYKIDNEKKEVEVIYNYSGVVELPEFVIINNEEYKIV